MIRALIVDDEAPARDRLRRLLLEADVEIIGEAANGDDAISRIDALTPDVVFLDIQMPALSGIEVAARLRAPRPRIVFCTAFDHFAVDAFEVHAVDYLLKPVNRDRLSRTVERISRQVAEQRRHARERSDAAQTQQRLMPDATTPGAAAFDCSGACVPADGVGGDYYDFLPLGDRRMGVALGDVSGKGMYAGLLAAALQARMQTLTAQGVQSPARVLLELNRLTVGTIEDNRFATVFFAAFDRGASALTYANAGHPPAIVVRANGEMRTLEPTGPAVGWTRDARFAEQTVTLAPGDMFALYSDGISETLAPGGGELGIDGLVEILRRHSALPCRALVAAALEDLVQFSGGAPARDDRTLVVGKVRRQGPE